jgi:hypothetical protein
MFNPLMLPYNAVKSMVLGLPEQARNLIEGAQAARQGEPINYAPYLGAAMGMGASSIPEGALGALSLRRVPKKGYMYTEDFKVHSDKPGVEPFDLSTFFDPKTKDVYVDWMGYMNPVEQAGPASNPQFYNTLGPTEIRSFLREIKRVYPQAETISGFRIGGARRETAGDVTMRLPGVQPQPYHVKAPWEQQTQASSTPDVYENIRSLPAEEQNRVLDRLLGPAEPPPTPARQNVSGSSLMTDADMASLVREMQQIARRRRNATEGR